MTRFLPTDLPGGGREGRTRVTASLSERAVRAWHDTAGRHGLDTTTVLLGAWAVVLARRTGVTDLPIGLSADDGGPLTVRCVVAGHLAIGDYLASVRAAVTGAAGTGPARAFLCVVPCDDLDDEHPPVLLLGSGEHPTMVLDASAGDLTRAEAADLLDSLDTALIELAGDGPLRTVRTISPGQARRLLAVRNGPDVDSGTDLWDLIATVARTWPSAPAVRDADGRTLDYAGLLAAVHTQADALSAAGVTAGATVAIALPRGTAEIVAVLAALRLGAAYTGLDPTLPEARLRALLTFATSTAVLAPTHDQSAHLAALSPPPCTPLTPPDRPPFPPHPFTALPPAASPSPAPEAVAYVAFTSGSTGGPKGVRVPRRAVTRLVPPGPHAVAACGPGERMLRLAPLSFDASTLEIFAPLTAGGCVEVYPDVAPSPPELAAFLAERGVTVLWLTSGLFRLMVDLAPEGFAGVRHVLTGGDVVPPERVRALLTRWPGLRVTNGYGPTENTTFTTAHHVRGPDDIADPLPIGTPIAGGGALALDADGLPVPPGGIGELYATGDGLALDYLGRPEETAAAFGLPAPDTGERTYRTGDLVRLDALGRWRYLGRRDRQVKIRGFRIELEEVRRQLLTHPRVRDAVVTVTGEDAESRRLLAALVPSARPGHIPPDLLDDVRQKATAVLPAYAVPALWAIVPRIPLTPNGKVDTSALSACATATPQTAKEGESRAEELAGWAWGVALGGGPASWDADFFACGGDSLAMARLVGWLRKEHGLRIPMKELYSRPTAGRLAELIDAEL
ncbi:amino acid adenylation domain-containing protein [Spongiactinospora sp. TRM90649]|uniref:non-ribosomal peptide synthetase n=1 Tax=Spongiactinospora sp. TRM90649 TaxID=3031114 RepID=UPI0023F6AE86|nr:amino acid adenylation domain-containing protein [Spongiactinospora sp. TRM90649]MDF5757681.1 amino acid adenylation domain-containing protein [Spongiactinospora sp. TRM90649]